MVGEQDQLPLCGDVYDKTDAGRHYRYESDFAPFKPRTDLTLTGSCHTPGGRPLKVCPATFSVGDRSKTLWVFGNRYWRRSLMGQWSITDPEPFSEMPVIYENSFGGPGYDKNPVGKGHIRNLKKNGKHAPQARALPNIEDTRELVISPHSKILPPGFGPLDRMWRPRVALAGTLNKTWLKKNWPNPPDDFDWGYFNAAPKDMQVEGYLRGDEELYFENLHHRISTFRCRLPGLRARAFVSEKAEAYPLFREVPMNLDTLWVDMSEDRVVLVWRGITPVQAAPFGNIDRVLVVTEDLGVEKRDGDFYFSRYQTDQAKSAQFNDDWASVEEKPQSPPPDEVESTGDEDPAEQALKAQIDNNLNQARALLRQSQTDPELVAALETESDPEAFLHALMSGLNLDTGQVQAIREQTKRNLRDLLSSQGEDPSIVDELFISDDLSPPGEEQSDRAALIQELKTATDENRDFSARDLSGLDLSNMDLKGVNFTDATLDGAVFENADLSGTDFSRASLEHADFSRAVLNDASFVQADLTSAKFKYATLQRANLGQAILVRADATGADFTEADLSGAVLEESILDAAALRETRAEGADFSNARLNGTDLRAAIMDGALFEGAQLRYARLNEVSGSGAIFISADLSDAGLSNGCFANANFADAILDRAHLDACDLSQATLERSKGDDVNMAGADLTGVKAGEGVAFPKGNFQKITAPRSIWTDGNLEAADFSGARLERADFSRSRLVGARFGFCQGRFANFDTAGLKAADFHNADLFMANLARADMEACNLSGGNFYSAEFLDARFMKTNIQGANLTMTKLAGR